MTNTLPQIAINLKIVQVLKQQKELINTMGILGQEMPFNDNKKLVLMDLIKEKGIVIKHVTLFSKVESEYYYDLKNVEFQPEGIHLARSY
ncbi:hypothetical protein BH18THE2_BH18THE2_28290 [soil metagenome]